MFKNISLNVTVTAENDNRNTFSEFTYLRNENQLPVVEPKVKLLLAWRHSDSGIT